MITSKDVEEGRVAPKTIENGVVVPPGLQVNCITLEEHRQRLAMMGARPLTPEEEAESHPDEALLHVARIDAEPSVLLATPVAGDTDIPLDYGDRS